MQNNEELFVTPRKEYGAPALSETQLRQVFRIHNLQASKTDGQMPFIVTGSRDALKRLTNALTESTGWKTALRPVYEAA
jgi:hypothetical protein